LEWNWNPTLSNWIPIGKSWNKTMEPKPNGPNDGRGEDGRFLPGNPGGPGNPYPRQVAALRNSILQAVTPKDIEEIIKAQIAQAKQGDTVAAKFILERVLGRPQVIDLALVAMKARIEEMRVESDEKQQKELYALLDLIP
jgi:hypothetical protein